MKYLKLYEKFGLLPGDTDKTLEEVMQEYINWDLIEDIKMLSLEHIDKHLSTQYWVFIRNNKTKNILLGLVFFGEFDHKENYKEFQDFSGRSFEPKHIGGVTYKDILDGNFELKYTFNVLGEEIDDYEDGSRSLESNGELEELEENILKRLKMMYDEDIEIGEW